MTTEQLIKFTVYRDSWLRGTGQGLLLDAKQQRCCLGFLGKELGCSDEEQRDVGLPDELPSADRWPEKLVSRTEEEAVCNPFEDEEEFETVYDSTAALDDIITVNDDAKITDAERESKLVVLFRTVGIDVEFKDGVGP